MTTHKWGDKERPSVFRSLKHCRRCSMICVSRHEVGEDGRPVHWREYWRGTERLLTAKNAVPSCELAIEQDLEQVA